MSTVLDALAKADEEGSGRRAPQGPGLPPEPPRRRPPWVMLAVLFCVIVVGGFAVGLFWTSPDTKVAEVSAPKAPAPGDAGPAVGALARAPSAKAAAGTQEELAAQRRAKALAVRRAYAARKSGAKGSKVSKRDATGQAKAGVSLAAKDAAGSAGKVVAGRDAVAAASSDKNRVLSPAQKRRAERRALRLAGRDQRIVEREELAEARNLNRDGKLTREDLRDLRRGQRDRTRAGRDAGRLERRLERDAARNAESAPVVMRAEVAEKDIGIPPSAAGAGEDAAASAPDALAQVAVPGPPPEPPADRVADIRRWSPSGQPKVAIQILQWSTNDARRFAYVSLDGGRATQVREGDQIGTLKVTRIYREVIEFGHDGGSFLLRAN
ncbi:MAG: hypothetical protein VCC00_12085 [Deltaproteobacteria bacterium]